ncbi:hypothetical protein GALMADRAFT_1111130 [Galerina marginata CBS 339.88]|uniref:RING-type domain-containing protein n=1 Tax=Galerina marginata (strain CBS 339.88) TaxID=685588 RepID=A0A067TCG0_GALM3|nr:hypothetical protein GALMADRAFT_1111130 [Galerina marginata CBS 339.88]
MPSAHCPICFNHFPLGADKPEVVIYPCGHGYCTDCSDKLFREARPKCPTCRVILHRRDGHPVYLELVDSSDAFAASVIEGLDQMKSESPVISVRKASQKLEKILQGGRQKEDTMSALLKAIESFQDRIIPMFSKVENQKHEIDALRKELHRSNRDRDYYQGKARKAEPLQTEIDRLGLSLREAEHNTNQALCLAEAAKDDLGKVHEKSSQWQKHAAELDQDNRRLKDQLERHVDSARLQKEKNKKLAKQVASLSHRLAEREPASDATHGYDGDFSAHEESRIHSSFAISSSSSRSPHHSFNDENESAIKLDFEGMPPPNFPSDWQLNGPNAGVLKKHNVNVSRHTPGIFPRFPIDLDRKGRPTKAVQLGPRSIVHVGR